jgi:hypothetical protein
MANKAPSFIHSFVMYVGVTICMFVCDLMNHLCMMWWTICLIIVEQFVCVVIIMTYNLFKIFYDFLSCLRHWINLFVLPKNCKSYMLYFCVSELASVVPVPKNCNGVVHFTVSVGDALRKRPRKNRIHVVIYCNA